MREGGLQARCCDEHVVLDLGLVGQETTGPGGLVYAMRNVPVCCGWPVWLPGSVLKHTF
ncbi:hypothetical protein J3U06_05260 [Bifidobacterium sp. B4142]|nr:hypothetical protein [Bifidobacterium sp. B4142]